MMDDDDYFRLALRNSIYHSISSEVYQEVGQRLPTLYMFYIEGLIDNKNIRKFIEREGKIW